MNTIKSNSAILFLFIVFTLLIPPSIASSSETEMVEVKGGEFKFGKEGKVIDVKTFQIDEYEVTNALFKKFQKEFEIPAGKENHPVVEVSFFEAQDYCKSVGKRLPTHIEWEKAARGTDGREFPWGNEFIAENANTVDSGLNATAEVGSFKGGKSPFGAHDMAGNVWEWVDAWDGEDKKYRLTAGGSFFDDGRKSKIYSTLKSIPDDIHTYIGFRCAK